MKKLLISTLCACLLCTNTAVYATEKEDIGSVTFGTTEAAQEIINQYRFSYPGGHGFAAEEANNLIDVLHGEKAKIVGYDNATNGADRIIENLDGSETLIQDKFWSTAYDSVNDAFSNGEYRYINPDGTYQQLEVAYDQYDEVISLMQDRIKSGQVPGITDPEDAYNLVRQSSLTYDQIKNLAKSGTVESLKYDATQGFIYATCAFGISTLINYVVNRHNGMTRTEAIKDAGLTALKTGGEVFAITVIGGQIAKTGIMNTFTPSTTALVDSLGDDFADSIIKAYSGRSGYYAAYGTTSQAAAIIRTQGLISVVTIVVLSTDDVIDLVEGKISTKQMLKNLANTGVTVVFGQVGYYLGALGMGAISDGALTVVGGVAGSVLLGGAANFISQKITDKIYEGDAEIMLGIIEEAFNQLAVEYMITEEEGKEITKKLSKKLTGKKLKSMFASEDKYQYAIDLLTPLFDKVNESRDSLDEPTVLEMRQEELDNLKDVVFIH